MKISKKFEGATSLAFSSDGKTLATGNSDNHITL